MDAMASSAGVQSLYERLVTSIRRNLPLLWPSHAKEHATVAAVQWINESLLPEPHTARELAALAQYHYTRRDSSLASQIIDDALDRLR